MIKLKRPILERQKIDLHLEESDRFGKQMSLSICERVAKFTISEYNIK
ncbi:hypothetical protein ACPUYX_17960 [Desulfosporosinus sp. SYSU MS00001]